MDKKVLFVLFVGTITFGFTQEIGARYLIITHDSYYEALKPLAEWKTQKGFKAKIVRLSDIGSDSIQIRNYVVNAYNTWQIKPEYLLLVGNNDQIPFPQYTFQYLLSYSDNYYTNITGDFRNDILPGRFWVFDTIQAKTVVAKILGYEKMPYLADSLWIKKGVTIVQDVGHTDTSCVPVYREDASYAHSLMRNAGYCWIDSFAESRGDSSEDVINAINDGRSYILYRGDGVYSWWGPFYYIDTSAMFNGFKMPIALSGTCATVEGIGYEWLNAGTPDEPKGTVGFYGTTTVLLDSAYLYRSPLCRGTLHNIFTDSLSTLGKAAEAGRLNYYQTFGNTLEYDSWTCLGDPEMNVWTTMPRRIQVYYPCVWMDDSINIRILQNSTPIESALVCVKANHDTLLYHYQRTDGSGNVWFYDNLQSPDSGLVTVTGRNILPAQVWILGVYSGGPDLLYMTSMVLDTLGGNGNYQANNGEDIELAVWVLNRGDSIAHSVTGFIEKAETDDFYQLADTVKFFGDIAGCDSAFTSPDGYNVIIDPDCPDSHTIKLKLILRDINDSSWVSYFSFLVYSPRPYLIYQSCLVSDTAGGNGDHQVNPAEDIELPVWIRNIGDSMAENVAGILQKAATDFYYTITDTIKNFGQVLPLDSAWTGMDGYNIVIDSNCPDQHQIDLKFKIVDSLDSLWTYDFSLINHASRIVFQKYCLNDTLKYIKPGDTASLTVTIKNTGSAETRDLTGTLISADTLVSVLAGFAVFPDMLPDSTTSNQSTPFIIAASNAAPPNYATNLQLIISSGRYIDTLTFEIYIGKRDFLVWDPDPNHSSGFIIYQKLNALDFTGDYKQAYPYEYLNLYKALFACVGMLGNKYVFKDTSTVAMEMEHYLETGGKIYLEGGDVWFYDPMNGGYNFCPSFCITPDRNHWGMSPYQVIGIDTAFSSGMYFQYTGENISVDVIKPANNGRLLFKKANNNYNVGVVANHRTVGISFELSGLVDSIPPSTKLTLVDSIMNYFGIDPSVTINEEYNAESMALTKFGLHIRPNPAKTKLFIEYSFDNAVAANTMPAELKIYDVCGRLVKAYSHLSPNHSPNGHIEWEGEDVNGRKIPAGVYFVQLLADDKTAIKKIILLR